VLYLQRYNCFVRNGGNAILKHACPEAEGSNPTTGLTLLVTHSEGISITVKSHKKKLDGSPYSQWLRVGTGGELL
jgi:hypothetical protein